MDKVRLEAVKLIEQIFSQGAYTNILLNQYFRQHALSNLDRRFLTELVYGTVKAKGTLDWYLQQVVQRPLAQVDALVLAALRLALCQLLYMEKIPAAAAVNEAVEEVKILANSGAAKFANGVLRNFLRKQGEIKLPEQAAERLAIELWHPKELVKRWIKHYGTEEARKLCEFNNAPAPLCLRVNTLRCSRQELGQELQRLGVKFRESSMAPDGVVCTKIPSLKILQEALAGKFYIQDESSMLVGGCLAPKAGERVLDLCAAPGGKTTHLAQLMGNQGEIVACDVYHHKLGLIKYNADLLGIGIIRTELNDARKFRDDWQENFDRVLVDAPCSGLGVLRRRAEARWRKTKDILKIFPPLQQSILQNACRYVKQGGMLVYSTCTIEESENHYVVQKFLGEHSQFKLLEERQLLPQRDGVDGFYFAKLRRD